MAANMTHGHWRECLGFADHSPQFSSASRFTAGAAGFLLLIQSGERPDLYRESFRFDTIPSKAELAGMPEDQRAVLALKMLIEPQARRRPRKHACKRGFTHAERLTSQVLAVEFDKVEGIEEHARIMPPVADAVERRDAVLAARNRLAVDDARSRA
jgi:hypothetical protein